MTLYDLYFFLLRKLHTSFLHLSIFILFGKNGKSLCKSCNFLGYLTLITYHDQLIILILCLFFLKYAFHANSGNDKK